MHIYFVLKRKESTRKYLKVFFLKCSDLSSEAIDSCLHQSPDRDVADGFLSFEYEPGPSLALSELVPLIWI